jgi:hypothetical protein
MKIPTIGSLLIVFLALMTYIGVASTCPYCHMYDYIGRTCPYCHKYGYIGRVQFRFDALFAALKVFGTGLLIKDYVIPGVRAAIPKKRK